MVGAQKCNCDWKMRRALDRVAVTRFFLLRVGALPTKQPGLISGPFVYRLGHQVFNLGRGVQLPYGLPVLSIILQDDGANCCVMRWSVARIGQQSKLGAVLSL
jgi:hypothetical protein